MPKSIFIGLLLSSISSHAAFGATQIFKCTAESGAVTFNDQGCAAQSTEETLDLQPSSTLPTPIAQPLKASTTRKQTRVTVISDDKHPCGPFNSRQRRTDLIRKTVKSGMSRAEVESMYGKPLTQRSHNGILSATYRSSKGQKRSLRFNQDGCVP